MRASRDFRRDEVVVRMSTEEFTETVEWLEVTSPHDAATEHWREMHDDLFPEDDEA